MSSSAAIQDIQTIDVTSAQQEEAKEVSRQLHEVKPGDLRIRIESSTGEEVAIPAGLGRLLQHILRLAATGKSIAITQVTQELTSVEAAKMLGMSRPTLLKLASKGEIQSHKVGSHARFVREDIKAFQANRLEIRRRAFDELREFEDSIGTDRE